MMRLEAKPQQRKMKCVEAKPPQRKLRRLEAKPQQREMKRLEVKPQLRKMRRLRLLALALMLKLRCGQVLLLTPKRWRRWLGLECLRLLTAPWLPSLLH